jgi:hypothetical protein
MIVYCEGCSSKIDVEEQFYGHTVSCPSCNMDLFIPSSPSNLTRDKVFVGRTPKREQVDLDLLAPQDPPQTNSENQQEPYSELFINCPACVSKINPQAQKCRYCGDILPYTSYVEDQFANKQINQVVKLMDSGNADTEIAVWLNQTNQKNLQNPNGYWNELDITAIRDAFYNRTKKKKAKPHNPIEESTEYGKYASKSSPLLKGCLGVVFLLFMIPVVSFFNTSKDVPTRHPKPISEKNTSSPSSHVVDSDPFKKVEMVFQGGYSSKFIKYKLDEAFNLCVLSQFKASIFHNLIREYFSRSLAFFSIKKRTFSSSLFSQC